MRVPMKTLEYRVRFNTPAFLGNADQSGQWRTPPFKALLRQWWRVEYSSSRGFRIDVNAMRREEGYLFGNAWLSHQEGSKTVSDHRKSQVRIRLINPKGGDAWTTGSQQGVAPLSTGLDTSYAWFGLAKRGKGEGDRSGIKPESPEGIRQLNLAIPDELSETFSRILSLIDAFGTLGSRSRGGWGALSIDGIDKIQASALGAYARELPECLQSDWPMSLASDSSGVLVWKSTSEFDSWDKAMRFIAFRRKAVRTALKASADLRPALGFATPGRMSSPLRWKVMPGANGKLAVSVFAMPHRIPDEAGKQLSLEKLSNAWQIVVRELDTPASDFKRLQSIGN